jgi:Glycosyl transferase family 2
MLSICIPIYNYDVTSLVRELSVQANKLGIQYEIICIDDYSEKSFIALNEVDCSKYGKYFQLNKNIGRSKIRNLFLNYSKFDYMLFLDCDSIIISDNFIENYFTILKKQKPEVICGGRIYQKIKPERQKRLRWKYGLIKESQPLEIRQMDPNKSFMTNNFVVSRKLLGNLKFNEQLRQYGHEDTLFGFQLKKNNISIKHIENPVLNGGLEVNSEYLKKTEAGLLNLIYVIDYTGNDPELINDITILKYYQKVKKKHLTGMIVTVFYMFGTSIKYLLSKGIANLFLFDFYKLGFFATQMRLKNRNSKYQIN